MATANELLADISTVDKTLIISNDLRTINIPSSVSNIGVEYDDDVLRLEFRMPRYIGDTDLSAFAIRINYINSKGESDAYTVNDAVIGTQHITFSWLVGPTATRYKGNTKFNVCAKTVKADGTVDKEFNTTIATLPVLEGLEVDESIVTEYSDIIEQWKQQLFGIGDTEETSIKAVSQAEQEAIANEGARVLATIPVDYATAVSMTDNADRTKSDAIVCTRQGESIIVSDSSDDYLRGLKLFGKTTQVTTTGKNLLNVDENLTLTNVKGIGVSLDAGTYIVSLTSETHSGDQSPYLRFYDNGVWIQLKNGLAQSAVLTKPETNVYLYTYGMSAAESDGVTATFKQLMVSVNGGSYEPYSGGYASPSPDWPQPLNSVENPTVNIYGKNLLKLVASTQTTNGVTFTVNDDQSVTIKGTATASVYYGLNYNVLTLIPGEQYTMTGGLAGSSGTTYRLYIQTIDGKKFYADYGNGVSFTATDEQWQVLFAVYKDTTVDFTIYPVLRLKSVTDTTYEPYTDQSNITLPYSLPAIPVSEDGNYTDANGQQWICDEIDFERGVYIRRVKKLNISAYTSWRTWGIDHQTEGQAGFYHYCENLANRKCMSNCFPYAFYAWGGKQLGVGAYANADDSYIIVSVQNSILADTSSDAAAVTSFTDFISNTDAYMFVCIPPIETPLTAEEIEWFRFAHTNCPNTAIINDAGATMELTYNADTKTYLDNCSRPTDDQVRSSVDAWLNEHYTSAEGVSF